ncbi:MAG: S9 family peptidase [bacterium]|nr:S9 family peptidase [bacterium]
MNHAPIAVALAVVAALPVGGHLLAQAPKRLKYEDVSRGISWQSGEVRAAWDVDRKLVRFRDGKRVHLLDPATGEMRVEKRRSRAPAPKRKRATIYQGDVWLEESAVPGGRRFMRARKPAKGSIRLTTDGAKTGRKQEAHLSPNGEHVSFVRNNDLVVLDATTKGEWTVTQGGGEELFHGALDWVYQEELYGRGDFQAHWWSPKSTSVAFLSLDESPVREFTVVNHVPEGFLDRERAVDTEITNYPKAGDPNPFAKMSVAHVADRRIVELDLSRYPKDVLVVRVDWTPDGKTLLVTLQDRVQTWAELCGCDPDTGKVVTWIREESPTWVNRPSSPRWLADGTFLWLSERTGYQHIYHYAPGGTLQTAVTNGEWQVRSIARVDEARRQLWFEGTKDGATGRHYYRVGLDGSGLVCVTPGVGTHAASFDAAGNYLIDRHSAMDRPPQSVVRDARTGKVVHECAATKRDSKGYAFSERERLTIKARDGYELDACLMRPVDWQPGQRYPIFLPTYSGPDAPTVRDSWRHSTYNQFLAHQGFLILQVNVRSASGRGQQHTGMAYQNLGVAELRDLEDAVDHVCQEFGGDPDRVAISGWSYGGFMAAYALTHSKKFALGLAGAGVYDWRLYDTIYTERYMRTPQENKAGYDRTSVIKAAKDLHGHLVILHGTMDDNVHMQNAMQLLWALQKAGKQNFELMMYPRSRHGLNRSVSRHSREFQWRRLARLLEPKAQ